MKSERPERSISLFTLHLKRDAQLKPNQEPAISCCGPSIRLPQSERGGWVRFLLDPQIVLTVLCGLALAASFFTRGPLMPYAAVVAGSYFALKSAWSSLRNRAIDVNFLMVLAAVGAIVVDRPQDAAALLFLFSLSSTLEALAMARTRSAIAGLVRLRPDKAVRVTDAGEEKVPVEDLRLGDRVKVPPYESIPVDGTVLQGRSSVDQSAMTGESIPVDKFEGGKLLAGTRNLEGTLLMDVASTVGDSTLDKIVSLVQDAQDNKASGERISTWFGQRYTFFVVGVFAVALLVRTLLGQHWNDALYGALTLLVALSPCALVISTPATTLSALAWAARNGMLVRGGQFIEQAGHIDTVALDKTGTLTAGRPRLEEICVCASSPVSVGAAGASCADESACWREGKSISDEARELLRLAAAAEQYSAHPIAEALVIAAEHFEVEIPKTEEEVASPGLGVRATIEGKTIYIGQLKYLQSNGVPLSEDFLEHAHELEHRGMTVALLAYDGKLAALGFIDAPREDTPRFLDGLKEVGVKRLVMITGDTAQTANAVAKQVGIADVRAGLLPAQKTEVIDELTRDGGSVMMVGDGINDAPCLAKASLGVAMGGLGSDIALNAADVVLMHDRLDRIPELIKLGRFTNNVIKANLLFASGMILTLTALSLFWTLPLPWAVVGHEGSTVVVILNGLRVLRGPR